MSRNGANTTTTDQTLMDLHLLPPPTPPSHSSTAGMHTAREGQVNQGTINDRKIPSTPQLMPHDNNEESSTIAHSNIHNSIKTSRER